MSEKFKILVIGDIMLDRYIYVTMERCAEEVGIPVWDTEREETRLGGAANVANNLKALGGDEVAVYLAGVVDRERYYARTFELLRLAGVSGAYCTAGAGMIKTRYVDVRKMNDGPHSIIFRHDNVKKFESQEADNLADNLDWAEFSSFDAVVVSDYDKGTVTQCVMDRLIEGAQRRFEQAIVVDSKRLDLSMYRGADVLKINEAEYGRQVSEAHGKLYRNVEELFGSVVVTLGRRGAELRQNASGVVVNGLPVAANEKRSIVHSTIFGCPVVPPYRVMDVTGCGDTHTAAMTLSLLKRPGDVEAAVKFANLCAANVVTKFGTSVADHAIGCGGSES